MDSVPHYIVCLNGNPGTLMRAQVKNEKKFVRAGIKNYKQRQTERDSRSGAYSVDKPGTTCRFISFICRGRKIQIYT